MAEELTSAQLSKNIVETKELINTLFELIQTPIGFFVLLVVVLIYLANKGLLASMFNAFFDKTNEQFKFVEKLLGIKDVDEQVVKIGLNSIAEKAFKRFTKITTNKPRIDALIHLEKNTSPEISWTIIKRAFSNISIQSPTEYTINKPRLNDVLSYYYNEFVIKLLVAVLLGSVFYLLLIAPKEVNTFIAMFVVIAFLVFLLILIASTNFNFTATIKLYNELKAPEDSEISSESLFNEYTLNFLPNILNKRPTTTVFIGFTIIVVAVYIWRWLA